MNKKPLVSIGIPLYNDEDYVEESLKSLLNQTYKKFEIIISDDNSTDNSPDICKKYTKKDNRIKYFKNNKNLGEIDNFNQVIRLAKGKYFMWATGHDKWNKGYISKCIQKLEENPKASVCFSYRKYIDKDGDEIKLDKKKLNTLNNPKFIRFIKSIWILCDHVFYGVIKTDKLKKTRGYLYVLGPDHVLRTEMAFQGEFAQIEEELLYMRIHREENQEEAELRRLTRWSKKKEMNFFYLYLPHLATVHEYSLAAIHNINYWWNKCLYTLIAYLVGCIRYAKPITFDIIKFPARFKYIKKYGRK
jgi:glycosyltransferase involved in cell wall biosynthesis